MQISINLLPWRQQRRFHRGREMAGLCVLAVTLALGVCDIGVWLFRTWQQQTRVAINDAKLSLQQRNIQRQVHADRVAKQLLSLPPNAALVSWLHQLQNQLPEPVLLNQLEVNLGEAPPNVRIKGESTSRQSLAQFTQTMTLHELKSTDGQVHFIASQSLPRLR